MSGDFIDWKLMFAQKLQHHAVARGDRVTFTDIKEEEFRRFLRFLVDTPRIRIRYHYYPEMEQLQVKLPCRGHEAVANFLSGCLLLWNMNNFPTYRIPGFGPVRSYGSADISESCCQPDAQFILHGRATANVVVEVSNSEAGTDIVQDCKKYFETAADIMLAIGIKYWRRGADAAMAIVIYERSRAPNHPIPPYNRGVLRQRVSFGNRTIHGSDLNSMNYSIDSNPFPNDGRSQHPWEGVGFGEVPCNQPNQPDYLLVLPARYLLCLDNVGDPAVSPFYNSILANQQNAMPADLIADLYFLQDVILASF